MSGPDEQVNVAVIDALDASIIKRVYSGRPGCGCGCRGTYSDSPRTIKRIVANMKKRAHDPYTELDRLPRDASGGVRIGVDDDGFDNKIFFVEDNARYLWAYTHLLGGGGRS